MTSAEWTLLSAARRDWNFDPVISAIALAEASGAHIEQVETLRLAVRSIKKMHFMPGVLPDFDLTDLIAAAESDTRDRYIEELTRKVETLRYTVLPTSKVDHDVLADREIRRIRPCKPDGKGARDTLMWLSLLDYLQTKPDSRVFLVSNDDDFRLGGRDRAKLHPDLVRDIEGADLDPDLFRIFSSLSETLAVLRKEQGHSASTKEVLGAVASSNARRHLLKNLKHVLKGLALSPSKTGLPLGTRTASVIRARVKEETLEVSAVKEQGGNGVVYLQFDCDFKATIVPTSGDGEGAEIKKWLRCSGYVTWDMADFEVELNDVETFSDDPMLQDWAAERARVKGRLGELLSEQAASSLSTALLAFAEHLPKTSLIADMAWPKGSALFGDQGLAGTIPSLGWASLVGVGERSSLVEILGRPQDLDNQEDVIDADVIDDRDEDETALDDDEGDSST